ncbi:hypothetical protein SAMN06296241_3136 [Salinimicrobium sediminis]|uniref:Uncharacterized protein n=1 Tax=Salinimicrobium sediminis TaxID=1343891 RepID=A0A285X881_9FLAO|nr:hypothetical protein SAMN06296241_3136 [Salinimicrobium sediminis]
MCTSKKPSENCLECGKFYATEDSNYLCKKCSDQLCKNCWTPHSIPPHLLGNGPHFCDSVCQTEFLASQEIIKLISQIIQNIDVLRELNYRVFGKESYRYNNRDFIFSNDHKLEETTLSLKIKHHLLPSSRLSKIHTSY